MKKVLIKENVAKAMADLVANGKKPTLINLAAALGNRGSTSTLIKLKAEIEAEANTVPDSDVGLQTFREVWALALDEGRKQNEATVNELSANIKVVCQENERLEGEAIAMADRVASLEKEKSDLESGFAKTRAELEIQLNQAQGALVQASEQARQALEQLAQTQSAHAAEVTTLRAERDKAVEKQRATELELAVCKARLEAK